MVSAGTVRMVAKVLYLRNKVGLSFALPVRRNDLSG